MAMKAPATLVADIGGTRARFALLDDSGLPDQVRILSVGDFAGPLEAIQAYLRAISIRPNDFQANLSLAAAYYSLDENAQALPYAKKAVEVQPQSAAPSLVSLPRAPHLRALSCARR